MEAELRYIITNPDNTHFITSTLTGIAGGDIYLFPIITDDIIGAAYYSNKMMAEVNLYDFQQNSHLKCDDFYVATVTAEITFQLEGQEDDNASTK